MLEFPLVLSLLPLLSKPLNAASAVAAADIAAEATLRKQAVSLLHIIRHALSPTCHNRRALSIHTIGLIS